MLRDSLDAMAAHIISTMPGFTAENCAVEDVGVFNRMLVMPEDPRKCIIVGFGGAMQASQRSDFGSLLVDWMVVVNAFFYLFGNQDDRLPQVLAAYDFADDFILSIVQDSTLGGQIMDARLVEASEAMTYKRNDIGEYMMLSFKFAVKENL